MKDPESELKVKDDEVVEDEVMEEGMKGDGDVYSLDEDNDIEEEDVIKEEDAGEPNYEEEGFETTEPNDEGGERNLADKFDKLQDDYETDEFDTR